MSISQHCLFSRLSASHTVITWIQKYGVGQKRVPAVHKLDPVCPKYHVVHQALPALKVPEHLTAGVTPVVPNTIGLELHHILRP